MFEKFRKAIVPHIIGILLIILGWLLCIINIGIDRFSSKGIFNYVTLSGLLLILLGAYIPEVWIGIRNSVTRKKDSDVKKE
jgi:hypothetical protein